MTIGHRVAPWAFALLVIAGCASTEVTNVQSYGGGRLARPDRILVYDFAATRSDLPSWSYTGRRYAHIVDTPTPQTLETGRQLGAAVATNLVTAIREMGLPAVPVAGQPAPRPGDIIIIGYFESIDTGSAAKRIVLGFGSGEADLTTEVEGYVMTSSGPHLLGSADLSAGGGKMPGVAIPLAVAVATGNPIGLAISSAAKIEGQVSGRTTIEGSGKRTAEKIAEELKGAFQRQGWI